MEGSDSSSQIESSNLFQSILDTLHDAFITMDESGQISDWNRQAELTFGWTKKEALGQVLDQLIIPDKFRAQHRSGLNRFLKSGQSQMLGKCLELPALRKDGSEVEIEFTISAVLPGSEYVFGTFLKDISERRKSERYRQVQLELTKILIESNTIDELFTHLIQDFCKILSLKVEVLDTGWVKVCLVWK